MDFVIKLAPYHVLPSVEYCRNSTQLCHKAKGWSILKAKHKSFYSTLNSFTESIKPMDVDYQAAVSSKHLNKLNSSSVSFLRKLLHNRLNEFVLGCYYLKFYSTRNSYNSASACRK
jgi:hypothetical protein